jgi:hypothetical protein
LRTVDFLLLVIDITVRKRLLRLRDLRMATLIELGPGPTRLAFLKRCVFRHVYFLDISDYGIPDPGLRIIDLESVIDARRVAEGIFGVPPQAKVLFFADHCLEHIPEPPLLQFFDSLLCAGFAGCFRMPNIFSPRGHRNYLGDPTHRTSFDEPLRQRLQAIGFAVSFWIRWYRISILSKVLAAGAPVSRQAEEIVLSIRSDG